MTAKGRKRGGKRVNQVMEEDGVEEAKADGGDDVV